MSLTLDLLPPPGAPSKSPTAFKTIGEVAAETGVPQHVLRFWEAKFSQLRPLKRGGGRRYYRPEDVALLHRIRRLLHDEGYTIKGVQKVLREQRIPVDEVAQLQESVAPVSPLPRPAPGAFPRTRMALSSPDLAPARQLVLDVELLDSPSGRERLLLDVLDDLRAIRSALDDV